jgi:hypothetical protein
MGNKVPPWTPKWLLIVCIVGIALVGIYIAATSPTQKSSPTPTGGTVLSRPVPSPVSRGPVYADCAAAHNAGVSDIPKRNDAYWPGGDSDGDGVACESRKD